VPGSENHPCPSCGAAMLYETRADVLEYKGAYRTVDVLGWWCTECDEAIFTGNALRDRENAHLVLEAEVDKSWPRDPHNGRYRVPGTTTEVELSEGELRGAVLGVDFSIPMSLVMHVIAGGPVKRTLR
jgi:YgiT-type zinc finger domain-containing protein